MFPSDGDPETPVKRTGTAGDGITFMSALMNPNAAHAAKPVHSLSEAVREEIALLFLHQVARVIAFGTFSALFTPSVAPPCVSSV